MGGWNQICIKSGEREISISKDSPEHRGDNEAGTTAEISSVQQKRREDWKLYSRLHLRNTRRKNGGRGRKRRSNSNVSLEKKALSSGLQGATFCRNKVQIVDDEEYENLLPEKQMISAIIQRALTDATAPSEHLDVKYHHKKDALYWLFDDGRAAHAPWGFKWCAFMLLDEGYESFVEKTRAKAMEYSDRDTRNILAQLSLPIV